jgi:hypothetical protein
MDLATLTLARRCRFAGRRDALVPIAPAASPASIAAAAVAATPAAPAAAALAGPSYVHR